MPYASWTRAHAAESIHEIGQAVQAAGGRLAGKWLEGVLHRLKHQGPERVLKHLAWLAARYPSPLIAEKLAYLQKREAHMQYPRYQAAGWPIGSGNVESANKVVVEARLKGAGMRWERHNVNPMLVLRNAVCNRRWHETWQASLTQRQALRTSQRQTDSNQRLAGAFWTLVLWGVRVHRLAHPPAPGRERVRGRHARPPEAQRSVQAPRQGDGSVHHARGAVRRRGRPHRRRAQGGAGADSCAAGAGRMI